MIDLRALERAIRKDRAAEVGRLYLGSPEDERKATRPLIRELERESSRPSVPGLRLVGVRALSMARLATTPSAEGAARELRGVVVPEQIEVVLDRSVRWKRRLTELLTEATADNAGLVPWALVDPLLAQLGIRHLDTPGYAVHWLSRQDPGLDADAQFVVDPALPTLLLAAFDSARLQDATPQRFTVDRERWDERRWAELAAQWAREGRLDADELHRAILACLIRGGTQPHLRAALTFLEELAPAPEAIGARAAEYLALLESRQAFVARHGLTALRAADERGLLDTGTVLTASEIALARADTGIPQAALTWLKETAGRSPEVAAEVARAASVGLTHPKRAVQEKALALVRALPGGEEHAEVVWAMDAVSPTISGAAAASALPERPPAPMPPPLSRVESSDELVDLARRMTRVGPGFGDDERLLDGVARFGGSLTQAQRDALVARTETGYRPKVLDALAATRRGSLLTRLLGASTPRGDDSPDGLRAREVAQGLRAGAPMVSFPRDCSGMIDPDRLLDDLRRARRASRAVPPLDLEAAWLRLPLDLDEDFVVRVEGVGSASSRWLANELRRGPLAPPAFDLVPDDSAPPYRALTAVGVWSGAEGRGGDLLRVLVPRATGRQRLPMSGEYPTLLPAQREAAVALDLPWLVWGAGVRLPPPTLYPFHQGRVGTVTHLALLETVRSEHAPMRASATDAALGLLATDAVGGASAAPVWTRAVTMPSYKLGRLAAHLEDVRGSSIAGARYAWELLRRVLPALFEVNPVRQGTVDLVGIAAEAALVVGASGAVSGLDAIADRPGKTRLAVEARRLRTVLSGG